MRIPDCAPGGARSHDARTGTPGDDGVIENPFRWQSQQRYQGCARYVTGGSVSEVMDMRVGSKHCRVRDTSCEQMMIASRKARGAVRTLQME